MNVLLVEDEPRVADFINRGLRAENHGVTVASSGSEGVDLAKTGEFDVRYPFVKENGAWKLARDRYIEEEMRKANDEINKKLANSAVNK